MPVGVYKKSKKHLEIFLKNGKKTRFQKGHVHSKKWYRVVKIKMKNNKYSVGNTYWIGKKHKIESIIKMSLAKKGKKVSQKTREKISIALSGPNHYLWKKDRSKLCRKTGQGERRTSSYAYWRKCVWKRDNWKCRMSNNDCKGKIVAHHIMGWKKYPKLRYNINNGITLCQFHHPRKRADEQKLIPFFQNMVEVK